MIQNPAIHAPFSGGAPGADRATAAAAMKAMHTLPIPWVDAVDISNAVVWLASDEARYVTGVALPVDGGLTIQLQEDLGLSLARLVRAHPEIQLPE